MISKIDHIAIAVNSLEKAKAKLEQAFGLTCDAIEEVASEKVKVAFFQVGDSKIELLEPLESDSPIASFLEKRGEGIHHIAFRSDSLDADLDSATSAECRVVSSAGSKGAGGSNIAFLHPKDTLGALIELCQRPD